jgi:hypothetical protein
MAAAQCEAILSCAELRKDIVIELVGGQAGCLVMMKHILASDHANRERARQLAQGSLRIQNEALEACLDFQRSCLLAEGANFFQPCREVFEGSVPTGGSCRFDDECAGDAYCMEAAADAGASPGCPGTCASRKPAGSPCGSSSECAGLYTSCDFDPVAGVDSCRDVSVVEGIEPGAACGQTGESELSVCRADLWCGSTGTGRTVCRELIPPDGACQSDFEVCADGYFCAAPTPGSCQPVTVAGAGEACDYDGLAFCDVFGGFFCVGGRCEGDSSGDIGTPCGTDAYNCDIGLFCDGAGDTCQSERAAGEACLSNRQCASGSCGSDSRCEAAYCDL